RAAARHLAAGLAGVSERAPRPIPLARPSFGPEEEAFVLETLRSRWVAQGPRVVDFEARFAEAVGAPCAVALSSATSALFLALHAHGIGPGDEVITPSLTFIASANAVVHTGATPVLVDVEPDTCNVDPAAVEAAIGPRTRAILPVHQLGLPADLDALEAIATRHRLLLVRDPACPARARARDRRLGEPLRLQLPPAQGDLDRRGRHADARRRAPRRAPAAPAPPGDVGLRPRAPPRRPRDRRVLPRGRLQLPPHRPPGRARPRAAAQARELRRRAPPPRRALCGRLRRLPRPPAPRTPLARPAGAGAHSQSVPGGAEGAAPASRQLVLAALPRRGIGARRGLMAVHLEPAYCDRPQRFALPHSEAAEATTLVLPIFPGLPDA